jgi:hypothetical protein
LSHYVEGTIAQSTAMVMKSHGGRTQVSTRAPRHDRYGLKRINRPVERSLSDTLTT